MVSLVQRGVKKLHRSSTGTTMQELSTGVRFRATLAKHPPVLIDGESLGYDPRMASIMEVLQNNVPDCLGKPTAKSQTLVKDTSTGIRYRVVSREDNGADFTTEFTVLKIVEGKDK